MQEILRQYFNLILWQQFCHHSDNKHLSLKYEKLLSSLSGFPSLIHFSYSDTDPVAWRFQMMMSSTFLWSHESPAVPVNTIVSRWGWPEGLCTWFSVAPFSCSGKCDAKLWRKCSHKTGLEHLADSLVL